MEKPRLSDFTKYKIKAILLHLVTPQSTIMKVCVTNNLMDEYILTIYGISYYFDLLDYNLNYESIDWNKWDYIFRQFISVDKITVIYNLYNSEELSDEKELIIDRDKTFKIPPYLREKNISERIIESVYNNIYAGFYWLIKRF
jgi:hypothetical protein